MKRLIAHRGNVNGPNASDENSPGLILRVINEGYDAEIDLRLCGERLMLGHDTPMYETTFDFLREGADHLWIHCKNYEALDYLSKYTMFNFFFHTNDEYVMTSKGFIFTRPGGQVGSTSVMVMPELVDCYIQSDFENCYGVCSDHVADLRKYWRLI